jgi:hypothetical protein
MVIALGAEIVIMGVAGQFWETWLGAQQGKTP